MPQLDFSTYPSQLIALMIGFALTYFIVAFFLYPILDKISTKRETLISGNYEFAKKLLLQIKDKNIEIEKKLKESKIKAENLISNAMIIMDEKRTKHLNEIEKSAMTEYHSNINEINQMLEKKKKDLQNNVCEIVEEFLIKNNFKIPQTQILAIYNKLYNND